MKRRTYFCGACLLILGLLAGCEERKSSSASSSTKPDSVGVVPDSTLYGRLGEGTGMSTLEFITDCNDTLILNKMSEYTGEYGEILGTITNYTDRFGIVTSDNNQSVRVAVNVNQLAQTWRSAADRQTGFQLNENGKASPLSPISQKCSAWQLYNGKLLFYKTIISEYGEEARTDTTEILLLDTDSLMLRDNNNQIHKYYH